jgi:hypothetical protein
MIRVLDRTLLLIASSRQQSSHELPDPRPRVNGPESLRG